MLSFNLFGIPIFVQPWFWVTMVFIGGGVHANDALSMALVAVFVLAGFISILVHELGHALTIRKFGQPTQITLVAFGGFAAYPPNTLDRKQSFLVTAAGPALQIALGLAMLVVYRSVPFPPESLLAALVFNLTLISIIWAVFNCLPIFPMDGGQMLAALLGPKHERTVFLIGAIVALIIGALAFMLLRSWLIPIFMGLFFYQNLQSYRSGPNARRP